MTKQQNTKLQQRNRRHIRIRAKIHGTADKPRLAFFRSNKQVYAQIIDDDKGITLCATNSLKSKGLGLRARAEELGKQIAEEAKKNKITSICFDRGGFLYTGSVKAFADAARSGGLKF